MRWSTALLALTFTACEEPAAGPGGLYTVDAVPSPDPPTTGPATLTMTITDADGPVLDADVAVAAWMPDMGHGVQSPPTVTEDGDGVYVATWIYPMPGFWELTISVDAAAGEESLLVTYDVE